MTDLAALTARAEEWLKDGPCHDFIPNRTRDIEVFCENCGWEETVHKSGAHALLRDLLTYATTVTQERDTAIFNAEATRQGAGAADTIFRREIAKLRARVEHAEQERDAAIASAHTAYHRLQHVDPPHSLLGRRCFACPGTIVAACNRCGQKYATPIAQETP